VEDFFWFTIMHNCAASMYTVRSSTSDNAMILSLLEAWVYNSTLPQRLAEPGHYSQMAVDWGE